MNNFPCLHPVCLGHLCVCPCLSLLQSPCKSFCTSCPVRGPGTCPSPETCHEQSHPSHAAAALTRSVLAPNAWVVTQPKHESSHLISPGQREASSLVIVLCFWNSHDSVCREEPACGFLCLICSGATWRGSRELGGCTPCPAALPSCRHVHAPRTPRP